MRATGLLRVSAIWAVLTGTTLGVMELRANWGDWQWWPWWLVDFVAAALLIFGGMRTIGDPVRGRHWLSAGWAFTFGMAWMSMAGNTEAGPDPARDARLGGAYLLLVGSLVASSLIGLLLTLAAKNRAEA